MKQNQKELSLKMIPSVDSILECEELTPYRNRYKHSILKKAVQMVLDSLRRDITEKALHPEKKEIISLIVDRVASLLSPSLKRVINATGVIINTNLGRAPLGKQLFEDIIPVISGYNNLEFDLSTGTRGSRHTHLANMLKLLLDCEDAVIVNNNAAALFLTLKALIKGKEVIISRGELVEIGGSFRIPDILVAGGAVMIEVGTTNKTKISDYVNAITANTVAILKVHKSNYYIGGFTEEVSVKELSSLAQENGLLTIFDFGTGLPDIDLIAGVHQETGNKTAHEPDIKTALKEGADIVTFSCDKLLGGPQAGIIAGKKELVSRIKKDPLMRVLRVDKIILSALNNAVANLMLNDNLIKEKMPLFRYLNRNEEELQESAEALAKQIADSRIEISVVDNRAKCGGGTLPDYYLNSKAVMIEENLNKATGSNSLVEHIYYQLMQLDVPVIAFLKEGRLYFDVITLEDNEIREIGKAISEILLAYQSA